jgi:polyphosphate kinase
VLETGFKDNVHSWALRPDGQYTRNTPGARKKVRCQEALYRRAKEEAATFRRNRRTEFETHHAGGAT